MDVIKDRLAEESPQQYTSVKLFLADLRKMFRNCFTFNQRDTEIYKHAKKMEEKLDALLEVWVPEFANDPLINVGTKRPGSPRAGPSKKKRPGSAAGAEQEKKKRGRKKKKPDSDFDDASDSDDGISEV
ncbi:ankyrin repeat, bromo and BTB domain-containing protein DDB_G0293800 isoform X2 [Eurytemora carolleeae]|uniref:ankyrin repeat, bromo and BTB domain-containing protein DDB_G0293800 isoform X2 n=1 Tax=Eurytemora carolleeae TaxID=1294199 RepID=UPI000C755FD7|nr:ankyrin repeat, bromo and BTB domain-containing protein DDB_G0293800 isoform X2 [Eurytemora carolleeae]|eukprot:XP_023324216.1 ankyrin repeat, bromo and BTB domain-containing protein DDB_G0293800-like isoform X2 [Eurytemora affinis]